MYDWFGAGQDCYVLQSMTFNKPFDKFDTFNVEKAVNDSDEEKEEELVNHEVVNKKCGSLKSHDYSDESSFDPGSGSFLISIVNF